MSALKAPPLPDSPMDRFGVQGLDKREWLVLALEALDQAGVTPNQFQRAYQWAHGDWEKTVWELVDDDE